MTAGSVAWRPSPEREAVPESAAWAPAGPPVRWRRRDAAPERRECRGTSAEGARAVGPGTRAGEADARVGQELDALLGQRRTKEIVAEFFEDTAVLGAHGAATVEIEPRGACVPG